MNKKLIIISIFLIGIISFCFIIFNDKNIFSSKQKEWFKETFLPWQQIEIEKRNFGEYKGKIYRFLVNREINFQKSLSTFNALNSNEIIKIKKNLELKKYTIQNGFFTGIAITWPGSGFLEFYQDDLFVISARGILGYGKIENEHINFKQINHNIYDFINEKQFLNGNEYSIKDLHIFNNKIFISYLEEIKKDCWNTSLIFGNLNYDKIIFNKLHSDKNCINSKNNSENEFNPNQSGGRIISSNENLIYFSIGEYRSRYLAQDKNSSNGKIIKINLDDQSKEIVSMGHRNPQGLYFSKKDNFIIETEHGPFGGDEINIIPLGKKEIPNFGWPIASYGEHYSKDTGNKDKLKKYPLLKSHTDNDFIEPAKYFVPSIGISQIVNVSENIYLLSSLRENAIYFLRLTKENKFEIISKHVLGERIRDITFKKNMLIMFLENTASIGIIDFKNKLNF